MQPSRNYLSSSDFFRTPMKQELYSNSVEAACVVRMHTFQSRREWMDVCVISAGLHLLSRQSIPIKASCSPGDCRGGACSAGSNHPLKTTKIGWLWLEGNAASFRDEWGRGGVGKPAPSEPKELETTTAEGEGSLGGNGGGQKGCARNEGAN